MGDNEQGFQGLSEREAVDFANLYFLAAGMTTIRATAVVPQRDAKLLAVKTQRGAIYYLPTFSVGPANMALGARSILKPRNKAQKPRYMINGQALPGTEEVAFFGEQGPRWIQSRASMVRWMDEMGVSPAAQAESLAQAQATLPNLDFERPMVMEASGTGAPPRSVGRALSHYRDCAEASRSPGCN